MSTYEWIVREIPIMSGYEKQGGVSKSLQKVEEDGWEIFNSSTVCYKPGWVIMHVIARKCLSPKDPIVNIPLSFTLEAEEVE